MLKILFLMMCMFFSRDSYGVSLSQFWGRYEYNCDYHDRKLCMDLAKIPCHELEITKVDTNNNCLDGYLYDAEGEKRWYHIDIITEKWPCIYNRGRRILFTSLHPGDEVMIYTNWQMDEMGYAGSHCDGFNLCWVKQIELLNCPHIEDNN